MRFRQAAALAIGVALVAGLPTATHGISAPSVVRPSNAEPRGLSHRLDVDCADLASAEDFAPVVGPVGEPLGGFGANANLMQEATLKQSGGFDCYWLTENADSFGFLELAVWMTALPDSTADFEAFRLQALARTAAPLSTELDVFDGALVSCAPLWQLSTTHSCHWNVLEDDVWFAFEMSNVALDDLSVVQAGDYPQDVEVVIDVASSRSVQLIGDIIRRALASARETDLPRVELPGCASYDRAHTLRSSGVVSRIGDETDFPAPQGAYVAAPLWLHGADRLGFERCIAGYQGDHSATFFVTRGLDWMLSAAYPPPPGLAIDVAGLGTIYDSCQPENWEWEECSYLMVAGDILIGFEYAYDVEQVEAISRSVLGAIADQGS